MDIRQLKYFLEVAKQKSFTKAAETLHISQPTISKMIKSLEDEFNVILFDRSARHIVLTDAGLAVFIEAQKIVDSFNNISSNLYEVMNIKKGEVRIGLPPMVGVRFFPQIISEFKKKYPQISINMVEYGAKKIVASIEDGELDLGVGLLPLDEKFIVFPFAREELRILVYPEHFLADRKIVKLNELQKEKFIFLREDFALHETIINECIKVGYEPNVVYKSSQWDFISEMVASGLGVALLPESICNRLDKTRIKSIKLVSPTIYWHLGIIWLKDRYLSFAAREWLNFAREKLIEIN